MHTSPTRRPGPASSVILTGEFDDVSGFNRLHPVIDPFSGTVCSVETVDTSLQYRGYFHWNWYANTLSIGVSVLSILYAAKIPYDSAIRYKLAFILVPSIL